VNRQQKFGYRLAELHSQFVKAVGAGGSAHQEVIQDACRTELRERCQAAWEILRNVAIDFSLPRSAQAGEELKGLMRELVADATSDFRQAIELTKGRSVAADARDDVTALIEQVLPVMRLISTCSFRLPVPDERSRHQESSLRPTAEDFS
jgi:hypothetical protein